MINGGVLSTAGRLVFQGQGTGEFAAYDTESGRKLWTRQTGSAIDSVPVSVAVQGEQYILLPVGWGSAYRLFGAASLMTTESSKYGPSRLLAFKLGGSAVLPSPNVAIPPVPKPPDRMGAPANVARGAEFANSHMCTGCHGMDLDGSGRWQLGGAIPDLRYMPEQAHREWYAIVLGGSHKSQGMLAFGLAQHYPEIEPLTPAQADDIHAYVIDMSWKAYEAARDRGRPD
jgi:mono/diheme cytochrome c family protein